MNHRNQEETIDMSYHLSSRPTRLLSHPNSCSISSAPTAITSVDSRLLHGAAYLGFLGAGGGQLSMTGSSLLSSEVGVRHSSSSSSSRSTSTLTLLEGSGDATIAGSGMEGSNKPGDGIGRLNSGEADMRRRSMGVRKRSGKKTGRSGREEDRRRWRWSQCRSFLLTRL